MSPYVRTVKAASGARAVQIAHSTRGGKRDIEHIGSARDEQQLGLLKPQSTDGLRFSRSIQSGCQPIWSRSARIYGEPNGT